MLPSPVDLAHDCVYLGVAVAAAWARSSSPLPCETAATLGSLSAVVVSRRLTWSGVRVGRCERSSAAAPETAAAAWEVPLPRMKRSLTLPGPEPKTSSAWDPGTRRLATDVPGATTSGRRSLLPAALLEKS